MDERSVQTLRVVPDCVESQVLVTQSSAIPVHRDPAPFCGFMLKLARKSCTGQKLETPAKPALTPAARRSRTRQKWGC